MGKRRSYSEETKAAVLAALLEGQAVSKIAKDYEIPASTIRSWKSRELNGDNVAEVTNPQKAAIGELLHKYLRKGLESLTAQMEVFADSEWLKTQDAQELAVLHGVLMDKQIRLLEALGSAGIAPDDEGEPE